MEKNHTTMNDILDMNDEDRAAITHKALLNLALFIGLKVLIALFIAKSAKWARDQTN